MVAYMNEESYLKTLEIGEMVYFSRSRNKLWHKGESSGHTQEVEELLIDCDLDTIVAKVRQKGAACHNGYRSCFYRKIYSADTAEVVQEKVFDPDSVYKK